MSSGCTFLLFNIFIAILLSVWAATVLKDLTTFGKYVWTPLSSVYMHCNSYMWGNSLWAFSSSIHVSIQAIPQNRASIRTTRLVAGPSTWSGQIMNIGQSQLTCQNLIPVHMGVWARILNCIQKRLSACVWSKFSIEGYIFSDTHQTNELFF